MFSATVSDDTRLNAWNTNPIRCRRSSVSRVSFMPSRAVPPRRTDPEEGRSSPAAQCKNVLFPEPEGPITAVKLPLGMPTVTSRRAATAPWPFPYTLLTASKRTTSVMPFSLLTCRIACQRADHRSGMTSSLFGH